MASVNRVTIVGNLGRDPEMRTMPSGDQLANVTIATTDKWKDKATGEAREATEWHRVTFNGRLAEVVGQYLRKGSQVYVEGSLRTRKWTDQAGVEKFSTEIRADQMQMLGARQDGGGGRGGDGGYDDGVRQAGQQQPQQRQQDGGNQHQQGNGNQGGWQQRQAPQGQQQGQAQGQQRGGYAQPQQRQAPQQNHQPQHGNGGSGFDDMDDSIPF